MLTECHFISMVHTLWLVSESHQSRKSLWTTSQEDQFIWYSTYTRDSTPILWTQRVGAIRTLGELHSMTAYGWGGGGYTNSPAKFKPVHHLCCSPRCNSVQLEQLLKLKKWSQKTLSLKSNPVCLPVYPSSPSHDFLLTKYIKTGDLIFNKIPYFLTHVPCSSHQSS